MNYEKPDLQLTAKTTLRQSGKIVRRRLRNLEQTAFHLNVAEETLREWNETSEGPQVTFVRGQPMYHIDDVEKFVNEAEAEALESGSNYLRLDVSC